MESNFSFNSQPKKENTNIKDYFNIVIIGDSSIGKTSILEKYINNAFEPNPKGKKLIEIYKKKISYHPNCYKLKFWDITKFIGKNDISEINMFYNCDGIIFVSSYDSKSSLENLNIWYQFLIKYIDLSTKEMIWFINKKDLGDEKVLTKAQIEKKSKDLLLDFCEVSAKTGENLENGIKNIVNKIIKRINDSNFDLESSTTDSLENEDTEVNNSNKCNIF